MKDAFENNMKQSLDNFEMPYDSAAWTAMQSRLDASASTPSFEDKMKEGLNANEYPYNPAAWSAMSKRLDKGAKGGYNKWYYAAGMIGAAAITTALLWNSGSDEPVKEKNSTPVEQPQTASNSSNSGNDKTNVAATNGVSDNDSNNGNGSDNQNTLENINTPNAFLQIAPANGNSQNGNQGNSQASNSTQSGQSQNTGGISVTIDESALPYATGAAGAEKGFIMPSIPQSVCEGSTIKIENKNEFPVIITYPNGLNWAGQGNQVTSLNPSVAGTYKVGFLRNGKFKEKSSFVVHELPTSDIDFVDLSQKYLNGLPTIEVRSTANAASYVWEYENGTVRGANAGLHFYDAGLHLVKLTVTNENGCSSTIEKPVNVTEDYNLMAVNAFYPTGNDITTNTFMPYALTERNVNFKLIIVDPNDGHTMFETSDASEGWNGIDQQTGSLVPLEKSYIWKVTIMNPEIGEDNVYAGTILTLPQ